VRPGRCGMSVPKCNDRSARRTCLPSGQVRWWICSSMRCSIAALLPSPRRMSTSKNRMRCGGSTGHRSIPWPTPLSTPRSGPAGGVRFAQSSSDSRSVGCRTGASLFSRGRSGDSPRRILRGAAGGSGGIVAAAHLYRQRWSLARLSLRYGLILRLCSGHYLPPMVMRPSNRR
jgi:hypothetical protein